MFAVALALILSFIIILIIPDFDEYTSSVTEEETFSDVISMLDGEPMSGYSVRSFCDLVDRTKKTYCVIICNKNNLDGLSIPGDIPIGFNYGSIVSDSIYSKIANAYYVEDIQYRIADGKYHISSLKHGLFEDTFNKDTDPIYDYQRASTFVDGDDNYQCYTIVDDSTGEECGILFAAVANEIDSSVETDVTINPFDDITDSIVLGSDVIDLCNKYKDSEYCIFITTRGYAPDDIPYTTTAYNYCALAEGYYSTTKINMVGVGYSNGEYCIPNRIYSFGEVKHNNDFSPIYDESSEETYVAPNAKYKVVAVSDDKRKEICGLFCYRINDTITWEPESAPDDSIDIDIDEYLSNSANNPAMGYDVENMCQKYKNSNYSIIVCNAYNNPFNEDPNSLRLGYNFGTLLSTSTSFDSGEFYTTDLNYNPTDNKFHDSKRMYGMTGRYSTNLMSNGEDSPLQPSDSFTYYVLHDDYADFDCGLVFVEN